MVLLETLVTSNFSIIYEVTKVITQFRLVFHWLSPYKSEGDFFSVKNVNTVMLMYSDFIDSY